MSVAPNRLRELRDDRGLTRQKVAYELDLSERTVIRHEDGTTPLRRSHLLMYARYYDVDVDVILSEVAAA